jgi:ABC-2 type transport system permease protein
VRLAVAFAFVVVASVLSGLAAWLGAISQHADVRLGDLLKAGLNIVPPAVFVLGIGGLAFGLWPRGSVGVVYGLVIWSFLVETLASAFNSNHWLRDTSPLLHIAPVPAANPNWPAAFWLLGLGALAAALGLAAFGRRDVEGA